MITVRSSFDAIVKPDLSLMEPGIPYWFMGRPYRLGVADWFFKDMSHSLWECHRCKVSYPGAHEMLYNPEQFVCLGCAGIHQRICQGCGKNIGPTQSQRGYFHKGCAPVKP